MKILNSKLAITTMVVLFLFSMSILYFSLSENKIIVDNVKISHNKIVNQKTLENATDVLNRKTEISSEDRQADKTLRNFSQIKEVKTGIYISQSRQAEIAETLEQTFEVEADDGQWRHFAEEIINQKIYKNEINSLLIDSEVYCKSTLCRLTTTSENMPDNISFIKKFLAMSRKNKWDPEITKFNDNKIELFIARTDIELE